MRIIAFVTDGPTVRTILANLGEPTAPPRFAPPGSAAGGAAGAEWVDQRLQWDLSAQPEPAYQFDQRIAW